MDLRLFPLQSVLFPGMRLPLHIFEERYRLMIRECIELDAPFGVVLKVVNDAWSKPLVKSDTLPLVFVWQCQHFPWSGCSPALRAGGSVAEV
jgi:hypothetical protein